MSTFDHWPNREGGALLLTTTRGTLYVLSADGSVIDRSDGPRGWNYGGKWRIVGLSKRYHSARVWSLTESLIFGVPGWGVIHDIDHGTRRTWMGERARSLAVLPE
jgi:hypothetical protein